MDIDSKWLDEGQLLSLRLAFGNKYDDVYYRVKGREFADYTYDFGSVATQTATGWIDLTNAQQIYILQPRRDDIVFHFFVGISRSSSSLFIQYPQAVDRNALVGYRTVDATANGGIWGYQSPLNGPSVKSELFTLRDLRPVLNMWNNSPYTQDLQIRLYAMMYAVDGPFFLGQPEVGDVGHVRDLLDSRQAREYSIYGATPYQAPSQIATKYDSYTSGRPALASTPLKN